jgi:hypothetical protein
MTYAFTQEELDFHSALATDFVLEDCAVLLNTDPPIVNDRPAGDTAALKERVAAFKMANPSQRYLGYFDFAKWEAAPIGYRDVLKEHKDWFVYEKGAPAGDLTRRLHRRKGGGFTLDVTNPLYQDYISGKIAEGLAYYGMDGLLADNIHGDGPLLDPDDGDLLPDDIRANWADGEIAILEKIKQRIGGDKFLLANVNRNEKEPFAKRVIGAVDGVMLEDGLSPVARPLNPRSGRLAGTLRLYDHAADADKYVVLTANTYVDGSTFTNTNGAKEHANARYYLAAHLIFRKGKVLLLYNPPSASVPQYAGEAFFSDWNINVGNPTDDFSEIAPGVFQRSYTNSIVYLNSSDAPYTVTLPAGFDLSPANTPLTTLTLEAKTGFFASRPEAFQ